MYVKPKSSTKRKTVPLSLNISHEADVVFKAYATYTKYTIDELFDKIAEQLLDDTSFIEDAKKQRYNKKIMKVVEDHKKRKENSDIPF